MADIRIKDLATTASVTASDDFMAVDGVTYGTRKLSAATPAFLTSVTTPTLTAPASTDLTLSGGSTGASLVLGHTSGAATLNRGLTLSSGALTIGNTFNFDTGAAAGTRSINLGSTFGSGTWNIYNGATAIGSISSAGFSSNVSWKAPVGGGATFVDFGFSSGSGLYSPTANNISIANNNARVANFSTTALTLDYTTAGSAGAGALVVAGGGSFGGATYIGGTLATNTINGISGALTITSGSGSNFNLNAGTSGGAGFNFNSIGGSSYYTSNSGQALYFRGNTDASSGATTKNSPYFAFQSKYWDGAASQNTTALIELVASTTDASNYLSIGQWNFGGNAALQLYKTSLAATFAGAVTVGGDITGPTSATTRLTAQGTQAVHIGNNGTNSSQLIVQNNSTTVLTLSSNTATFGGPIKLANAYVATPVVSTGYVTLQDSNGTTYKVAVSL